MSTEPEQQKLAGISAPATYRELAAPFPSVEAANQALRAFWDELYELRKKHKIADLSVVTRVTVKDSDGEEAVYVAPYHAGDEHQSEAMLAYALGQAQARREEIIAKALARGRKK